MLGGFFSIVFLALVHLYANKAKVLGWMWHGRFLSFAAGISCAYVLVDLLPALQKGQPVLSRTFEGVIPYFDRHTYFIALAGLLFYYGMQKKTASLKSEKFWLAISGDLLFNFFVGDSLADSANPEIQPLLLFTIAMGMHYFVADHQARLKNSSLFTQRRRWWLVGALILGYAVGRVMHISEAAVAITISFVAGGVLLNVLHYELPDKKSAGCFAFIIGALFYAALLI
jgi:hypothetical protein